MHHVKNKFKTLQEQPNGLPNLHCRRIYGAERHCSQTTMLGKSYNEKYFSHLEHRRLKRIPREEKGDNIYGEAEKVTGGRLGYNSEWKQKKNKKESCSA